MSLLELLQSSVTTFVADLPAIACTPDHIGFRTESNEAYASYKDALLREWATILRTSTVNNREITIFTLPHPILRFVYIEIAQPKAWEELYTDLEHVAYVCQNLDEIYQSYGARADERLMINQIKEVHWIRYFKITYDGKEIEFREASIATA